MHSHSLASHGPIQLVLPDIYMVTGTNIVTHEGVELQHSRNMVIVRHGIELALINTVRLDNAGLKALDELGRVASVMRIGDFHGRDDAFYLHRYPHVRYFALPGMQHDKDITTAINTLSTETPLPIPDATLHQFKTSKCPEAFIYINREGGLIITCDSIKNWLGPDEYFSPSTASMYSNLGFFGPASISSEFRKATGVEASDYLALLHLPFKHLISAHGPAILNVAREQVVETVNREFKI